MAFCDKCHTLVHKEIGIGALNGKPRSDPVLRSTRTGTSCRCDAACYMIYPEVVMMEFVLAILFLMLLGGCVVAILDTDVGQLGCSLFIMAILLVTIGIFVLPFGVLAFGCVAAFA